MYRQTSHPSSREARAEGDFIALLERMTPAQRLRSSRGAFSAHQRATWAARYPEEVPLVNGEFEWIALTSADCD